MYVGKYDSCPVILEASVFAIFSTTNPGHSSDECKVLGGFGSKYSKIRLTKDHGQEPATNKIFNINQEKNAIVHHSVHQIILQDKTKLSMK